MKRTYTALLLSIVYLLFTTSLQPISAQPLEDAQIDTRLVEDGLFNFPVTNIVQDTRGMIWVGSVIGLFRYDGHEALPYATSPTDSTALRSTYINTGSMVVSGDTLWIGTRAGLEGLIISRGRFFTPLASQESPAQTIAVGRSPSVESLALETNGSLLIGRKHGLERYTPATGQHLIFPLEATAQDAGAENVPQPPFVSAVASDLFETIWVATLSGLQKCNKAATVCSSVPLQKEGNPIDITALRHLMISQKGVIYAGTDTGKLVVFDPVTNEADVISLMPEASHPRFVVTLHEDGAGNIWAGTVTAGISMYNPNTGRVTYMPTEQFPTTGNYLHSATDFLRDAAGVFWIATWNGLLKQRSFLPFEVAGVYTSEDTDPIYPSIEGVAFPGDAPILASTSQGTVWTLPAPDDTSSPSYLTAPIATLPQRFISDLHIGEEGALYIATANDGVYFKPSAAATPEPLFRDTQTSSNLFYTVLEDSKGRVWGGSTAGLWLRTETGITFKAVADLLDPNALQSSEIACIFEDSKGSIWIGTLGGGLSRVDHVDVATRQITFTTFKMESGAATLSSNNVISLYEDTQGTLWAGTMGGGLNKWGAATQSFVHYGTAAGIQDRNVTCITEDDQRYIWLGTQNGLFRFNPTTERAIRYGKEDGLFSRVVNMGACGQAASGRLYFGTEAGLIHFYPSALDLSQTPEVFLSRINVNNKRLGKREAAPYITSFTVDPNENFLSFQLGATDYHAPDKNQFAVKLEGLSDVWFSQGTNPVFNFPGLKPGMYTLWGRAINSYSKSSQETKLTSFKVKQPFYQQRWFQITALIVSLGPLLALVISGAYFRYKITKIREQELVVEVDKKTASLTQANAQLEDQALKLHTQAEKLQEMDRIKSRFFANVSHEFRNPLLLIIEPINRLLRSPDTGLNTDAKAELNQVTLFGHKLLRLVNQLLDLTALQNTPAELTLERRDLAPFVQHISAVFESLATKKDVKLHVDIPEHLVADYEPSSIQDILENLISNAIKFSKPGGLVLVRLSATDTTIILRIQDEGIGIPEADIEYLFKPFHRGSMTTAAGPEGTGIGLAYVNELVTLHNGSIEIESKPGVGSTFTVILPRYPLGSQEENTIDAGDMPEVSVRLEGHLADVAPVLRLSERTQASNLPTVLIVDDNAHVREQTRRVLSGDFNVIEADDGKEAIALLQQQRPALIVTDLLMPNVSGIQLCQFIRSHPEIKDLPVLMLTAMSSAQERAEGFYAGADDYLSKPWASEELLARSLTLVSTRKKLRDQYSGEVMLKPVDISISSEQAQFVEQMLQEIETKYQQSWFGVDQLADALGISRSTLRRKSKAYLKQNPKDFLRKYRMEQAAALLQHNAGTVSNIAKGVGYRDAGYFTELFKQEFGYTPSEYKLHFQDQNPESSLDTDLPSE